MKDFENTEVFVGKGNYEATADYLDEKLGQKLPRSIGRCLHLDGFAVVESC